MVYPVLVDIYLTRYVRWDWWRTSKSSVVRTVMSWIDAIVYALVLVYIIFTFIGQNYKIPSSSLEKTLLVGDYLWVNKMCLRAACAYHSNPLSSLSEHVSYNQHKELSRPSGKRIPSSERIP